MTTNPKQAARQDRINSLIDDLMKEFMKTTSYTKAVSQTEDAITAVLTEELMASLDPSERMASQKSLFETALFAEALAPALAEALAPALAEALVPALVKALNTLISQRGNGQEATSKKGAEKHN